MKIVVSACLLGENCKYNGGNNRNDKLIQYLKGHEVIPVCPEVLGGLPTPRIPVELVDGKAIRRDGVSVDRAFHDGAVKALEIALKNGVELAILQSRSPSCGVKEIYDGSFSGTKISGQGIFTGMLMKKGIKVVDAEDIDSVFRSPHRYSSEEEIPDCGCIYG